MLEFPVENSLSITEALRTLSLRVEKLNTYFFIKKLAQLEVDAYFKLLSYLPRALHRYLFDSILLNAGEYRKLQDQNQGVVFFGPRQQFRGASPNLIDENIQKAIFYLSPFPEDAVYNAVKFYQLFVLTHPFYDANGRIGRFLFEMYLNMHETGMQWDLLHENDKWLKKLNECHKRFHSPEYERYLGFLVSYWTKCTFKYKES